jgi:starvation-inducible DNA-binding protein
MSTNRIGLNEKKSNKLADELNVLLANYQLYYQNLRGFHWNIKGPAFFELHLKFEELYDDAVLKIDEIAERILTLGATPLHTFTDYLKHSSIKEAANVSDGEGTVTTALSNLKTLLEIERNILELSNDAGDEGTNSLMSDYITQQEKTVWMLSAYLGKN